MDVNVQREQIVGAEVCTIKAEGRSGVPSNLIYSLKFDIKGRSTPAKFIGKNTGAFGTKVLARVMC